MRQRGRVSVCEHFFVSWGGLSEKGMRRGRLRRLHCLARRPTDPQLPFSRPARRRLFGDHHRGSGAKRGTTSDASPISGGAGISMRVLYCGHDHDCCRAIRRSEERASARPERESLSLHRLPGDRRRYHGVTKVEADCPGESVGRSLANPLGRSIVTGQARYTADVVMEGMLHIKVLRSPHAHARIGAIGREKALQVKGVHRVYTWEDVPRRLYTSATHEDFNVDPNDSYMLDNVVRFIGQRVAAVVAESEAAAEEGASLMEVDYEVLPAVFDPEDAMKPGAPLVHGEKGVDSRIQHPSRNILREIHGENGNVEAGFAVAHVVYEGEFETHRQQHVHLETHTSISYLTEDGRLHLRTSTQTPF